MVQDLQTPVPITNPPAANKSLNSKEVKKLVQAEQARIRQRRYRLKKALGKQPHQAEPRQDAHAIDLSNILNLDNDHEAEAEADLGQQM